MAIDMMELWGGFPSRDMLKGRDSTKGSDYGPLSPSPTWQVFQESELRAEDGIRQGEPLVPPVPGQVSTEQASQSLGSRGCSGTP